MKKVSVIIPVYNVETYLPQCLDSVLAQTYSELEILLVDDGSTDLSGKICDEYRNRDSRICVFHQKNQGAANAKNTGLDYFTGEYVTFLDSDDYVEKDWIETLINVAENLNAKVVECNFKKEFVEYSEEETGCTEPYKIYTSEKYMEQYLEHWTCSLFWNKLFEATLVKDIRFRKERRCIDDEFFTYKLLTKATKIVQINRVLYHYRQRKSSAVTSDKNKYQIADDALEVLLERYYWVGNSYPNLRVKYLQHDVDIMFYFAKFNFKEDTTKKFKRISWEYVKESIKHWPGIQTMINLVLLLQISKKELLTVKEEQENKNLSEYFL